jgi:hypothetical protein
MGGRDRCSADPADGVTTAVLDETALLDELRHTVRLGSPGSWPSIRYRLDR